MDDSDKRILENALAVPLGKAVSKWAKQNDIEGNVIVNAALSHPSCYIDETGVSHVGQLITVNCTIVDDDFEEDD